MISREAGTGGLPAAGVLSASGLPEGSLPLQYFRRALGRGRLSHAYLFLGPEGSGRRRLAREVAKALFCSRGAPCGACPSCSAVEHGNHLAVHVYRPEEEKGSVEIGDVRDLSGKVHLRRPDFLVSIIEDADRMTLPAANAILKTLEEPTGATLLILIARSSGVLLPTIVSRCHRIPFPTPGGAPPDMSGGPPGASPPPHPREGAGEGARDGARNGAGEGEQAGLGQALEELARPGFFVDQDPKEWLGTRFPGAGTPREAVRRLLAGVIEAERRRWSPPSRGAEGAPDPLADRLEDLLDLRADLDRNVNADLVLEALIRRGTGS